MSASDRNFSVKLSAVRSNTARYSVALLAPICIAAVMQLIWPWFEQTPASPFLLGVMVAAWYGGLRAGLLSVGFSVLLADYFFIAPFNSLGVPKWADFVYLTTLITVGVFISVLTELMQRAARRTEASLASTKQSEDRYRALVGTISQITCSTDPHGRITGDIPAWREITGQTLADVSGHGWTNALSNSDQVQLRRLWARAAEDKAPFEIEVSLVQKDRTNRYYQVRGVPIFEEDGSTIQEWFVTLSDIHERKRAERQFSEVVEGAPNGMLVVDGRGKITLVNAQIEKSFGYSRDELLGQPIEMLVPARFRLKHPSYRDSFMAQPAARPMGAGRDLFGLRKDGTEFPVEIGLNPLRTEQGVLVLGTIVDITARKQAEEKVSRSQQQLAGIISSAMDAIITVDEEQRIVLFNAAAEKMFLFPGDEAIGQRLDRFIPERFRPIHKEHIKGFGLTNVSKRAMASSRAIYGLRANGEEFPVEASISQVEASGQKLYTVIMRDVSERVRADARFRAALEAAPNAMIMIEGKGTIVFVNSQIETLFGYSKSELIGQPVEVLVPERFRQDHPDYRSSFFANPHARPMGAGRDLYGRHKDGREIPVEIGLNPLTIEEGRFVLASIIDITERKLAEERFRQVIEGAPNGMVIVDANGNMTLVNAQIEQSFGYTRQELLGNPIEMLVPERFRGQHPYFRNRFINDPEARPMGAGRDLFGLRKDGKEFPVEIGLNPIKTDQGVMVLGTIVDITARKLAEEDLRRSQQQLAGVIASAMDAIITVDEKQRIVLFNAAAEKMFLFPSEDAIGERLDRFIPERFRDVHKEHVEGFGRTRVSKRTMGSFGAIYGLRADGEEFPVEASISQIKSDNKKFYTVILRDITERKRTEEAMREQANILDLAPVLIRDLNGRIIFWNKGAEQMYGWTSEEALEKITHVLFKTEFPRPLEEIKARVLARGHWEGELTHTTRDGNRIVVASHWVLHKDADGKPKAILEVNNDITDRRRAEKEVLRLNAELEQRVAERTAQLQAANKELEAFSYSVSHDLRAPLRHINGFSQALLEDYSDSLDESGKGYLREVRAASQEMAQLIDDVLQLARVTRTEMRREAVNLTRVAHEVVDTLKKIHPERNIEFQIEEGLRTHGDKRLLKIVLTNLIGNAWKFTARQPQPKIAFAREEKNGEPVYVVRDNGAGFDMTYADKLFGAFQRLHTAGEFEGTGIGLATVQRIINRHGGKVWAAGSVNQGASFYFKLPDLKETDNGDKSDPTG
jgi:PAS domain S-box-containing protein